MPPPQITRYKPGIEMLAYDVAPNVQPQVVYLKAEDGAKSRGLLYSTGKEKTVVVLIHPRGDVSRHYTIPSVLEADCATFAQESRWPNNDSTASHELILGDIAAALRFLRQRFEKIVFLGYSGGGSIYSLYQTQATAAAGQRLKDTAAGDPYDLNRYEMPAADGIIFAAAHLGAGKMLQLEIDPSVVDEADGLSCDPELDMYNPDNGFRPPPEESRYSREFLTRYRAAQTARVTRLDQIARSQIETQRQFRSVIEGSEFEQRPFKEQILLQRRAMFGQFMQIFRTDANPATVDLSIDPSMRSYGSINSVRPDLSNYIDNGFARILTPRAWLSLWSGVSSRASLLDTIPNVTIPTAVISFLGDNAIHPSAAKATFAASPAKDKQFIEVAGDHFGFALQQSPHEGGREGVKAALVGWLRGRFS